MLLSENGEDDTCVPGLVVHQDLIRKTSRLWLLNRKEIETNELECKIGDWFVCSRIGTAWEFTEYENHEETRVDGWRVEVKVAAMMYRNCAEDLNVTTSVKLKSTLFSPIIGRIGVFCNPGRFSDGVLYEFWATYIPTQYEQSQKLRADNDVLWMVNNQEPTLPNTSSEKYDYLVQLRGVVIKIMSRTLIIKASNLIKSDVPKFGIFIAPVANDNVKRGDEVEFFVASNELTPDKRYVFAANCTMIKHNFVDFVNDFDNEFRLSFTPTKDQFERQEYDVAPYGKIGDTDRLIKAESIGKSIAAVVRFRFSPETMLIDFKFKEVTNAAPIPDPKPRDEPEAPKSKSPFDKRAGRNEFGDAGAPNDEPTAGEPTNSGTTAFRMAQIPRASEVYVNGKRYEYEPANGDASSSAQSGSVPGSTQAGNEATNNGGGRTTRNGGHPTCSQSNGSTGFHFGGQEDVGVVAAQTVDAYYVHCPRYPRDVLLPKSLPEFITEDRAMNVGQWVTFKAYAIGNGDRMMVQSFKFIDPLFPTMPSFNTILMECLITIPSDYNPQLYNGTVTSEFAPVVGDQDSLIRQCHHGKTLLAVMRRMKTSIANVFWNLEYIKF